MERLIIIGAGGHGKVVADIAEKTGKYREIAFLDDGPMTDCMGYAVIGRVCEASKYISEYEFFVAIGRAEIRRSVTEELLTSDARIATLIHPNAVIGKSVSIGKGTVVMAGAIVNPCAVIGDGCIINTSSSVDHDCVIGDYAHISVGAHLAGNVNIGADTWVGAGAAVINGLTVCNGCMIGAGAVVTKNICATGTYIGVPARKQ